MVARPPSARSPGVMTGSKPPHQSHRSDPASLLARGYTARFIGSVLPSNVVSALSTEEIEKDLRHMGAHAVAVQRYHQLYYGAVNRMDANNSANAGAADGSTFATALPVRIDPEEEKRVAQQRKKIAKAEAIREDLEQQYVALRAHYVQTCQAVKEASESSQSRFKVLQEVVKRQAAVAGLQRAKVQLTRDILAALIARNASLEKAASDADGAALAAEAQSNPTDSPLHSIWLEVEEELKSLVTEKSQYKRSSGGAVSRGILPWEGMVEPATTDGVPLLLSAISTVPEKSLGWATSGMFGSKPSSLSWFKGHLPESLDPDKDMVQQSTVGQLRKEVALLQSELQKERKNNQDLLAETGKARVKHDEWVAMIALVRQETEAVLHRHNILLDSDLGRASVERAAEEAQEEEEEEHEASSDVTPTTEVVIGEGPASGVGAATADGDEAAPPAQSEGQDDANDGDDEGEDEEEEDDGFGNSGTKRPVVDGEGDENPSTSNKRRRKV